eukprot:scaffold143594_cov139-Phaeocystis_antarctica.AAC.1
MASCRPACGEACGSAIAGVCVRKKKKEAYGNVVAACGRGTRHEQSCAPYPLRQRPRGWPRAAAASHRTALRSWRRGAAAASCPACDGGSQCSLGG